MNEIVERQDRNYSYDANGNMTGDGIRTYTWDAENRLVGISYVNQPEKKTTFQYDGLNRRAVMVETNGSESTTSTFLWDGTDLLRAQTGNLMKWYYPQGEIHGTENLFYVSDRLDSVRETVNQDHLITARMRYTAYGETQTALTPFIGKAPDYRYAGLFFHEQSGLYLAVFRAYDPRAGRWINRDPIGEEGGVNLYEYVESNPINAIDTLGNISQIVKSVGFSLGVDIFAGIVLFICPECEGFAIIIELGGELFDAAEDYYKGRHDIETNRKVRDKALAQICKS